MGGRKTNNNKKKQPRHQANKQKQNTHSHKLSLIIFCNLPGRQFELWRSIIYLTSQQQQMFRFRRQNNTYWKFFHPKQKQKKTQADFRNNCAIIVADEKSFLSLTSSQLPVLCGASLSDGGCWTKAWRIENYGASQDYEPLPSASPLCLVERFCPSCFFDGALVLRANALGRLWPLPFKCVLFFFHLIFF